MINIKSTKMTISKYRMLLFVFVLLTLTSCLKKDDIPDLSAVDPVIEFPLGGPGMKRNNLTAPATSVVDTVIALNIASPDPLNKDVTVSIKADPAIVTAYNTANGTTYTAIPDNLFQLESTDITIRAGYRVGRIKVKIKFNQFDLTKKYMLALSISNAPGLIISGNFGKFLWAFTAS
jgi:hypothetical protein